MSNLNKNLVIASVLMTAALWSQSVSGQRPSFAGSRPVGGSQKDKYHVTSSTPSSDITNRFGAADGESTQNTLAYGASQRPPMGVPLVTPEPGIFSFPSGSNAAARPTTTTTTGTTFFQNRFGVTSPTQANTPITATTSNNNNNVNNNQVPTQLFVAATPVQIGNRIGQPASPTVLIPVTVQTFNPSTSAASSPSSVSNFSPVSPQTTAQAPASSPLPLDAKGDVGLINHLNTIPEDHRPFWFLNYQAIEAHRQSGSNSASPLASASSSSFASSLSG